MASLEGLLRNKTVCAALRQAWQESQPGPSGGHEEGGFIVEEEPGMLRVIRWPRGGGNTIIVPAHAGCQVEGANVISAALVYGIMPSGSVVELGETEHIWVES